jgi:hypothetical protein
MRVARCRLAPALARLLYLSAAGLSFGAPLHAQPGKELAAGLPADRVTVWQPGLNAVGGIPHRTVVCATVSAATYGDGSRNAAAGIQAAIDACPAEQVVQLSEGEFRIDSAILLNKSITLRGRGPALTRLKMPYGTNDNLVTIGSVRWATPSQTVDLATSGVRGGSRLSLTSDLKLRVGEIVLVDQLTDNGLNFWGYGCGPHDVCRTWYTRPDRPLAQVLEVASVDRNIVTFTTPFHIDFKTSRAAQLSRFIDNSNNRVLARVSHAGVEDLHLSGGGNGNIKMEVAAYSWIKGIESTDHTGTSVGLFRTFRSIIRDSYIHTARAPVPGGGAYGIAVSESSSDNLVENNIVLRMNKVMVMQAAGGGNVIGYNYMDDGLIEYQPEWTESGINASHMTGTHFALFEGNQSFNYDAENVWGSPIYITVFRNHLTGKRRSAPPLKLPSDQYRRTVSLWEGAWWHTLVGNVLGFEGMSPQPRAKRFAYEGFYPWDEDPSPLWVLGISKDWGPPDRKVAETLIRGGNYDYVTNRVHWENLRESDLPKSLYLTSKPEFFGSYEWPWVNPIGSKKLHTLPARARFDAGTPFASPPAGGTGRSGQ